MAIKTEKPGLFEFMLERVKDTTNRTGLPEPQAFGRWFVNMYFRDPQDVFIADGAKDGKVDIFFTTHDGKSVTQHVMNTKFTREYNKLAPVSFYQEVTYFWRAFDNAASRAEYLEKAVASQLRARYHQLFKAYDDRRAELMFVTNHRLNENHYEQIEQLPIQVFHLDNLIQYLIDDLDGAMPRTSSLSLTGIHSVPAPYEEGTEVHTSIVFARLSDFIKYMQADPYDLLFMRNVRVPINFGKSPVNRAIRDTFRDNPKEFAFSNNGITLLCEKQTYYAGDKELLLDNPRVVNGSQTLHSIRDVPNPSSDARVMVRVIEIPAPSVDDLAEQIQRRRDVISKIAVRSNQQNPIKKWDLVSNDDFQLDLYRFFRQKGLFYERRDREWHQRSRELKSVGIARGPGIKSLTQYIASYYWNKKGLGPAIAKGSLGDLFEGNAYEVIRHAPPELAYQLYHVADALKVSCSDLARNKQYVSYLAGHVNLTLLAVAGEALRLAGVAWCQGDFTAVLERHNEKWPVVRARWSRFVKACIDHIFKFYKMDSEVLYKAEGYKPTYANYFKNQTYVATILRSRLPRYIVKLAEQVLGAD